MGAEQSTASPTKKAARRSSATSVKYVPPSDGYLDEYTVYNHDKAYSQKDLSAGSKTLTKRLQKLESQINSLSSDGAKGFRSVYEGIKDGNNNSAKHSNNPEYKELNRYTNIVSYDNSRVKVVPNHYNGNVDYINANYIDGCKKKKMYIATQGPVPASIYSFWQMVMEQGGNVIVMVTNLTEGTRLKCHQYWPQNTHTDTHGDITVTGETEDVSPLMIVRTFTVTFGGETRKVTQFQYTAWPDHGVPETTEEMLKFRHTVREVYDAAGGPIITHCSAGVGRTGTFIGLDRYLDACTELDDSLTVLDIVKDMRKSRNFMVQAQAQFEYLYMACYDGLVVLLEKINRDLAMANMSEDERQQQKQAEIEQEIEGVTGKFWARCHGLEFVPGQKVKPDVKHTLPEATKTAELDLASKVKPAVRLASLAKSKEIWVDRQNVPMSAAEHGYSTPAATAKLEDRLVALGNSRLNWTSCYEEAVKTWQSAQDHDGVMYDIGHELTPIESRVASLAAAETAWKLRGGKRSVADTLQQQRILELTDRLESLQAEIVTSETRWRARGDGFRQSEDSAAAASVNTVDGLGGLTSRLQMLQSTQEEWLRRGNWSKFDDDKFYADIQKIEEEEGAARELRQKQIDEEKAKEAAAQEETKKEKKEREKKEKAAEKEAQKKAATKLKIREKAAVQEEWSAHKAKQERDEKARAEAAEKQRLIDEEKQKKEAKAAEEQAAKDNKAAAARKASRFLKKQSK